MLTLLTVSVPKLLPKMASLEELPTTRPLIVFPLFSVMPSPLLLPMVGAAPAARRVVGFGPPLTLTGTVSATPSPIRRWPLLSVMPAFWPVVRPSPADT